MAGTPEVITQMERLPGVRYPVLVPNVKGLENLLVVLSQYSSSSSPPPTDEVAVFVAATDAFSKTNTNCTVAESLERTNEVVRLALEKGLRVRGYLSVVIACPYSGPVDYRNVRDLTKRLLDMGCYEVSLGDTTGAGNPHSVSEMLNVVTSTNSVEKLAVSHEIRPLVYSLLYKDFVSRVMWVFLRKNAFRDKPD
jgi:hydroxymethylglutaryl-CoA lyase